MAAPVEEKRGDRVRRGAVEAARPGAAPLSHVDDAHHYRRLPGPRAPSAGVVDLAAVRADPAEAGSAGVALRDGVGGDQAERAPAAQEGERPPEEVGHEVGVAVALLVRRLEPVGVAGGVARGHGVLPRERRIAHDGVEPRVLPLEHLGKLDLPVERGQRRVAAPKLFRPASVPRHPAALHRVCETPAVLLARLRLAALEECRHGEIAEQADVARFEPGLVPPIAQFAVGDGLVRFTDAPAEGARAG